MDSEELNRLFTRKLRSAFIGGLLVGVIINKEVKNRLTCKGAEGEAVRFAGRNVCSVHSIERISSCIQREAEGKVTMIATLDDGQNIFIDPITLNRFRQDFRPSKHCGGNVCDFRR